MGEGMRNLCDGIKAYAPIPSSKNYLCANANKYLTIMLSIMLCPASACDFSRVASTRALTSEIGPYAFIL